MSRNKEYEVKELLDAFLTRYAQLASEIRGHLQYEKDFSGSDTLSEGLRDPFSLAPYGRDLLQVCRELHELYGTTVRSSNGKSVDTMWVMLAQILHPSNESVRTILKRELRVSSASARQGTFWFNSGIRTPEVSSRTPEAGSAALLPATGCSKTMSSPAAARGGSCIPAGATMA